jgi:hypothetical protein
MNHLVLLAVLAVVLTCSCSPASGGGDGDADADGDGDGAGCVEGEWQCWGAAYQECRGGEWVNAECDGVCVEDIGCTACVPGMRFCQDNTVMECNEEGTGSVVVLECDVSQGFQCSGGFCTNACDEAVASRSNVGCEYWAVDLDNAENSIQIPGFPYLGDDAAGAQFAVVVANTDLALTAHVTAEINVAPFGEELELETVAEADLAPGGLEVFELPRRDADGEDVTQYVDDGPQTWLSSRAFRIKSTAPIVAYQFNPIDQAFSNDASLLLPTSGLDTHHVVLGWPPNAPINMKGMPKNRVYVAVVATQPDTHVKVTPTYRIAASIETPDITSGMGMAVPEIAAGEVFETDMGPFDLLNLETPLLTLQEAMRSFPEITGTIVESNQPVAVFFGADLASVGPEDPPPEVDGCCAEHLEAQIIPTSAMGKRYVVTRSPPRSPSYPEVDIYRVMAVRDGTAVTTNLGGAAASFTIDAGRFFQFESAEPFVLEASEPVHVAQFLVSGGWVDGRTMGDPSMLLYPAFEQWRGTYLFTTGRGFELNYAVIAMPEGASVTLDGIDVLTPLCDTPMPIGEIDGEQFVEVVCAIEDGAHRVESGEAFVGVSAYGYYYAGSYAYAAGSELNQIFLY